jgi:hypothetical protein
MYGSLTFSSYLHNIELSLEKEKMRERERERERERGSYRRSTTWTPIVF